MKEEASEGKPLVFIVDELDRCNPAYAVKTLERIKHLFCVPQIVFVLVVDKVQLANAIRGFYGSDKIDADGYLRKFIDLEYSIPQPNREHFRIYLMDVFGFNEFFNSGQVEQAYIEKDWLVSVSRMLLENTNLTLRDMEKFFLRLRLLLQTIYSKRCGGLEVVFLLLYLNFYHRDLYVRVRNHELTLEDFLQEVSNKFPDTLFDANDKSNNRDRGLIHEILASLIIAYNKAENGVNRTELLTPIAGGKQELNFQTPHGIDRNQLLIAIEQQNKQSSTMPGIERIMEQIELMNQAQVNSASPSVLHK